MTLSIRTILLSLSALLAAGTLPACDTDDELEALGVELEDIDAMTEEELDELAHEEEQAFEPGLTTPPVEPLPPPPRPTGELDLVAAPFFAHTEALLAGDKLGLPDDDEGCEPNADERDLAD
jgi:hypothetical protein